MTKLLVSVRNAEEARAALEGNADVVDVKEPRRGALGPADPAVWREIQKLVGDQATMSVALGELLSQNAEMLAGEAGGFTFAKFGFAGCTTTSRWMVRWERVVRMLPRGVQPVPVAYADHEAARSPESREVLKLAALLPTQLMLIDTYDKSNGRLTDHLTFEALAELSEQSVECDVQLALAGSLHLSDLESLLMLAPAYVGVRGAACIGGRDGTVDAARVKSLAKRIHDFSQNDASQCLTTPIGRPILPSR